MSDAPQQASPDLHAIFGIDGTPREAAEQIISVGRGVLADPEARAGALPTAEVDVELDTERLSPAEVDHDPLPGADVEFETIAGADHYIEVEHTSLDRMQDPDSGGELGPGGGSQPQESTGLTKPSRRGSSQRFLTDVIVDMGLVSRKQVDDAVANSRISGTTPERVLLESGAINQDGLARALAWTTSTSASSAWTWRPPTS
jgi:hypothetical protein